MTAEQCEFLKTAVRAAQYAQRSYGVPASITIAQAILESGWGKSALATECNNFFGIKASNTLDPETYEQFPTHEYVNGQLVGILAAFRRYASPDLCFGAHARLLALADRYRPAMAVRGDPAAFARALQRCGYSTNPNYASLLTELVEEFDLTQYDLQPEPPAQAKRVAA